MSLGIVATGKRAIRSGAEYARYFDESKLQGTDPIILQSGTNHDTLRKMSEIARKYSYQTKKIAAHLKASSLKQSLNNLWEFLYNHVQYKLDNPNREQLRTPLRTWKDRARGVDCDCYSIFISSVLHNWGIPHAFRMAAYSADFQHVYVVVPVDGKKSSLENNYYTVDPVVDHFNYEVPFSKKFDRSMQVQMLNGFGTTEGNTCTTGVRKNKGDDIVRVSYLAQDGVVPTASVLAAAGIPFTEKMESDGALRIVVQTQSGKTIEVQPVVGPIQAQQLVDAVKDEDTATTEPEKKTNWIWWVLAALGFIILTTDSEESKKKKSESLRGTPSPLTVKRKPTKAQTILHM